MRRAATGEHNGDTVTTWLVALLPITGVVIYLKKRRATRRVTARASAPQPDSRAPA
ncbi:MULTISPECIES: hypothetical protein [Methylosinus]|uniref:hypothetical protein n=1 Tax=Methylosinus TaxID=425 RepID=UPI0002DA4552|nr:MULTISPECIES: hypothetical protein [Methylosinus]